MAALRGSTLGRSSISSEPRPNKRLKLPGPAFRGGVCLCANELVPQGGALPPASLRPAA